MSLFRVKTTECRVGVVGLYNAGKTVFLTSLLNHLRDHDPDRFPLGEPGAHIRKFTELPTDPGWPAFNVAGHRDGLVHAGKWPAKTRDRSQYVCSFERTDWTFSDVLLKLYDLPGERVADAGMAGRGFADWSDHVLASFRNDTATRKCVAQFLELLETPTATADELLAAYRLGLANLILAYKPLIGPSTFLLDLQGSAAKPAAAAELAAARFAGLDANSQFCPLSDRFRDAEFWTVFNTRYAQYKSTVVTPFVDALRSCHSLVVLVDVTMILAGGVGMYDDARQILADLFKTLDPGETPVEAVGRKLAKVFLPRELRPGGITRVAFVAPKLDLVYPTDRDKLSALLRRLVGKLPETADGLKYEFFNAAAVVSTKSLPTSERALVGVPLRDADGKKLPPGAEQRFSPSPLPDDWPRSWDAGVYAFPEVYPQVPARKDCPPEQVNLDRVFGFVTDL